MHDPPLRRVSSIHSPGRRSAPFWRGLALGGTSAAPRGVLGPSWRPESGCRFASHERAVGVYDLQRCIVRKAGERHTRHCRAARFFRRFEPGPDHRRRHGREGGIQSKTILLHAPGGHRRDQISSRNHAGSRECCCVSVCQIFRAKDAHHARASRPSREAVLQVPKGSVVLGRGRTLLRRRTLSRARFVSRRFEIPRPLGFQPIFDRLCRRRGI